MKEINAALGLKDDASAKDAVTRIEELFAQNKELKAANKRIPVDLDEKSINARVAAGLSHEQAVEVERSQIAHDATLKKSAKAFASVLLLACLAAIALVTIAVVPSVAATDGAASHFAAAPTVGTSLSVEWARADGSALLSVERLAFAGSAVFALLALLVWRARRHRGDFLANALLVNVHPTGNIAKIPDAAFASRYLIAKRGTDVDHIDLCGVGDIPLGIVTDETGTTADLTVPLNVAHFGAIIGTQRVQAAAAVALDAQVVSGAAGQARTLPGASGTYYIIGRAIQAAAAQNDQFEIAPCYPIQRVVP